MKILFTFLLLLCLLLPSASLHLSHSYAAFQQTMLVSQSNSLLQMYKCKDKCLDFGIRNNCTLKYIRNVWARPFTRHKYLEGHCYVGVQKQSLLKWVPIGNWKGNWKQKMTEKEQNLDSFLRVCQNSAQRLTTQTRKLFGLIKIHSSFAFYSNGTFTNLQPYKGSITSLFRKLLEKNDTIQ